MYRLERDKAQPVSARNVADASAAIQQELTQTLSITSSEQLSDLVNRVLKANSIFLHGAGRSALSLRMAAMRLMHFGLEAHVVGDVTTPAILPGDVLIAASGSGSTGSVVSVADKAIAAGAEVIALTTAAESPLAERAALTVVIPAAAKRAADHTASVQYAGSLFEQSVLLVLDSAFHALWQQSSLSADEMWRNHSNLE